MDINVGKDYVSSHQLPDHFDFAGYGHYSSWDWYRARERYATAEPGEEGEDKRERAMADMLELVTEDRPPVNRIPVRRGKIKTWYDIDGRPHKYVRGPRKYDWVSPRFYDWVSPRFALVLLAVFLVGTLLVNSGVL